MQHWDHSKIPRDSTGGAESFRRVDRLGSTVLNVLLVVFHCVHPMLITHTRIARENVLPHFSLTGCVDYADKVNQDVPRVLINREKVGEADPEVAKALAYHGLKGPPGFNFAEGNSRDVFYQGDCDAGVEELCRLLGWSDDLHQLIRQSRSPKHEAHNPMTHPSM